MRPHLLSPKRGASKENLPQPVPKASLSTGFEAHYITLFPNLYPGPLGFGITGRALQAGLWTFQTTFLRDFSDTVDDVPYGGGGGMVMRADVLGQCLDSITDGKRPIICFSATAPVLKQSVIQSLARKGGAYFICPRFEGIDERLFHNYRITQISLGDYILSNGDIAALTLTDGILRYIPGILGNKQSLKGQSFSPSGLLQHPLYTRPLVWETQSVPEVLTKGDHKKIAQWKTQEAQRLTKKTRPDLWEIYLAKTATPKSQ